MAPGGSFRSARQIGRNETCFRGCLISQAHLCPALPSPGTPLPGSSALPRARPSGTGTGTRARDVQRGTGTGHVRSKGVPRVCPLPYQGTGDAACGVLAPKPWFLATLGTEAVAQLAHISPFLHAANDLQGQRSVAWRAHVGRSLGNLPRRGCCQQAGAMVLVVHVLLHPRWDLPSPGHTCRVQGHVLIPPGLLWHPHRA